MCLFNLHTNNANFVVELHAGTISRSYRLCKSCVHRNLCWTAAWCHFFLSTFWSQPGVIKETLSGSVYFSDYFLFLFRRSGPVFMKTELKPCETLITKQFLQSRESEKRTKPQYWRNSSLPTQVWKFPPLESHIRKGSGAHASWKRYFNKPEILKHMEE